MAIAVLLTLDIYMEYQSIVKNDWPLGCALGPGALG